MIPFTISDLLEDAKRDERKSEGAIYLRERRSLLRRAEQLRQLAGRMMLRLTIVSIQDHNAVVSAARPATVSPTHDGRTT